MKGWLVLDTILLKHHKFARIIVDTIADKANFLNIKVVKLSFSSTDWVKNIATVLLPEHL